MAHAAENTPAYHIHPPRTLLPFLIEHLPYTLPILRRTQFALHAASPTARLFATFPPAEAPVRIDTPPKVFTLLHVDRAFEPSGAEAFVFSSLELQSSDLTTTSRSAEQERCAWTVEEERLAAKQLLALLAQCHHLRKHGHEKEGEDDPMLLGSLNDVHLRLIREYAPSIIREDIAPPSGPWRKFVFRQPGGANNACLPPSMAGQLEWADITEDDDGLIASTNSIVASAREPKMVLNPLPRVGIRTLKTGELVAWGFLGAEGCVRTMFVKPEWRGMGLAAMVVKRLMDSGMGDYVAESLPAQETLDGEQTLWGHADASSDNTESVATFTGKSLRGRGMWEVWWVRIDAGRAWNVEQNDPWKRPRRT
ncbi:MAG: hypothetical protein M1828_003022 [Chrysothrix sp. TS-e1954]|nr:MAG: hypothetical protein M1828_003022 [Chrysothrix sp. TS-e1954]